MNENPIDTGNYQLVGSRQQIRCLAVTVRNPAIAMTPDDALRHAAWLVAIAEPHATHPFADVLEAVRRT